MDTTGIVNVLRYLISPEDTIVTRPETCDRGAASLAKTALWFAVALGCGMALAQLH